MIQPGYEQQREIAYSSLAYFPDHTDAQNAFLALRAVTRDSTQTGLGGDTDSDGQSHTQTMFSAASTVATCSA